MITKRIYARVGLAGNPSDAFHGKTVSACIRNFYAEVSIEGNSCIVINPNPAMDPLSFSSIDKLIEHSETFGYYGALRLLYATCSRFFKVCPTKPIDGFRVTYKSTIPRQVGLGGSSALVVGLLRCLISYCTEAMFLPEDIAMLAWEVENIELGITAGLQDRVIQSHGGLLYMDFDKAYMEREGHGKYESLDGVQMPLAFVAYTDTPGKFSGQMHNPVRFAYERGDPRVIKHIEAFARCADSAKDSLIGNDFYALGKDMIQNWKLRLSLYGAEHIGQANIEMIAIANTHGCPAKLPGSGGAVIGLYMPGQFAALRDAYHEAGYHCVKVVWDGVGEIHS